MNINVIKSKRKTCEIKVNADGSVTIKAPNHYTNPMIKSIIETKADWIDQKLKWMSESEPPLCFELGSTLPVWYEAFTIEFSDRIDTYLDHAHKRIMINPKVKPEREAIKREVIKLLRVVLRNHLVARVKVLSEELNVQPNEIRVKLMKSRWGSCSSRGNLNFSLNLVLLPKEIVDYIIIHELAHLNELNHSSRFWRIVEKYHPRYVEDRKWLKMNTFNLNLN
ncbi:M48 family metallopeptidase [Fusibacter sp. 3D3]|uniref:M48 family metallopeptidase n=1 Tax=Fusibacter sp. 3D3 TaxID=1048380 RepID=UPI0008532B29|nr:SprT family zinc-dependent metalloprotease [Fusibacter sp. 3D3]GAU78597.1 zinc metalloprotease [Fusibacter sp. 3D3]